MQRTAVIFGLALSTLVGSFFLVPRLKPAPTPTPIPTPVVEAKAEPVTELIYSDGVLEAKARIDRGYLLAQGHEPVWLDVSVKANGTWSRAPLTSVLVIDRSGSMAGDKIDAARLAGERYVNGLKDGDQLAVISFATDVTTEFPLTTIDNASRAKALRIVKNIEEGGGTNIDGALTSAQSLLRSADMMGRVGRVVLVTDGRPTEGDRRESTLVAHATTLRGHGITMSTLGLGLDYNEDLLEHMAVEGGGRYHYLKTPEQLARILDDELQQATAVAAADVKLYLPENGAVRLLDAPGAKVSHGGERAAIDVGDLAAGEERHVMVKLSIDPSANISGGSVQFQAPEIVYKRVADRSDALLAHRADPFRMMTTGDAQLVENSRRDDVRVRVLEIQASLALDESMHAYEKGDATVAKAKLQAQKDAMGAYAAKTKNAALAADVSELDSVLSTVNAAPAPASERAQDTIKSAKARAFELRR